MSSKLVITGDSALIIDFMLRVARPSRPHLYIKVKKAQALVRSLPFQTKFRHIPRDLNSVADALAREARA